MKNIQKTMMYTQKKRPRANFGKSEEKLIIPKLHDIQIKSYEKFIKKKQYKKQDYIFKLENILKKIFPIYSYNKNVKLAYISYHFNKVIFDPNECKIKGLTYSTSLKIKLILRVIGIEKNHVVIRKLIKNDVFVSELPLMTEDGTFIINGTERVVVSQIHKSPGLFFESSRVKSSTLGEKLLYSARIIPQKGSWLDIELDPKNCLFIRINKKRKFPATFLLKAFNMKPTEIFKTFLKIKIIKVIKYKLIFCDDTDDIKKCLSEVAIIPNDKLINQITAVNILDKKKNVVMPINTKLTLDKIKFLIKKNIRKIKIVKANNRGYTKYIPNTLSLDNVKDKTEALLEIHKTLKSGNSHVKEFSRHFFDNLFFVGEKFDLSQIGRIKLNERLKSQKNISKTLSKEDIINIMKKLIDIKEGRDYVDDIDHLGNRYVKSVGDIIRNQFKVSFAKIEKSIKEKLSSVENENIKLQDLVNTKQLSSAIHEFFCSSQLSQFMDQTNPLSEITHKRRLSALGPGGLTRERAGFEVRDVHNTHYGRICPIETPEGPNIGLINSLAIYARVNKHGVLETPYIKVVNKKIIEKIKYLTASTENNLIIAQSNIKINKKDNRIIQKRVPCRFKNEFIITDSKDIQYIDISPSQSVSISTALIPFLEHDDANRALMGSNMQKQAVPLLLREKPLVGTGIEKIVAINSGSVVKSKKKGKVIFVDSQKIIIKVDNKVLRNGDENIYIYNLVKYNRSNQNTCITQRPIVELNDDINKNDIIADGAATDVGELSLGQNILVAFMVWEGYNFEDSIIVSEDIVKKNKLASIHIEELLCTARESKLGPDEITPDIPNSNSYLARHLDESGITYIGAKVFPGDILVGKISEKSEIQLTPEEKLLQAIFGEKFSNVLDTSLRVPTGMNGVVINIQSFTKYDMKKDIRTMELEEAKMKNINKNLRDEFEINKKVIVDQISDILKSYKNKYPKTDITINMILATNIKELKKLKIKDKFTKRIIYKKKFQIERKFRKYAVKLNNEIEKTKKIYDMPSGVTKIIKITIATIKKLNIGDKISGRHGNKGVVSTIVPVEDMPYLKDGTHVEMILNPLGVPSRMNIGQVLETHLGWAAKTLGKKLKNLYENYDISKVKSFLYKIYNNSLNLDCFSEKEFKDLIIKLSDGIPMATPIFDGINEHKIKDLLLLADLPKSGKPILYDGKTGLPFDNKVTIGYKYIMKLNHLVDDKIHARSTGSYSLITQQPLGGKAQFGGQRFGEMEVWALEAYGAAYTLREMLTIKSDDILGRTKIYKNIINNNYNIEMGIPEAFNVLSKEILSLGLNIELEHD